MSVSSSSTTTEISAIHSDIIQTHIFTRLDGPALASASCVSSQLHSLSTEEKLWKDISTAAWPSISHPHVQELISTFSSGHRSFFSDAFPLLTPHQLSDLPNKQRNLHNLSSAASSHIISAVDIHYKNEAIFSKVHETGVVTGWSECIPLRVSLLDPKESVSTSILRSGGEDNAIQSDLEENLSLSWILIDPTIKRAANLSSLRPVSVQRYWTLSGDIHVKFATILAGDSKDQSELMQCRIMVTCEREEGGELHVREVTMRVKDMDGEILNGEESLVILERALKSGRRKKVKRGEEREKYEEYLVIKREWRERRERREREMERERWSEMVGICIGLTILVSFCFLSLVNWVNYSYRKISGLLFSITFLRENYNNRKMKTPQLHLRGQVEVNPP